MNLDKMCRKLEKRLVAALNTPIFPENHIIRIWKDKASLTCISYGNRILIKARKDTDEMSHSIIIRRDVKTAEDMVALEARAIEVLADFFRE